jgi:hypothetical protein
VRQTRVGSVAVTVLVGGPHVDVENDDGQELDCVADQHAGESVSVGLCLAHLKGARTQCMLSGSCRIP